MTHPPTLFYSTRGPYGCFSNFATGFPFTSSSLVYPTSEHYFQSMKFVRSDPEWQKAVRQAPSPNKAATMGRSRAHPLRPDWDEVKDDYMRYAVLLKFAWNPGAKKVLLSTRGKIIENSGARDSYWGNGADGNGKNMLGRILVETREALREDRHEFLRVQLARHLQGASHRLAHKLQTPTL